MLLQIARYYSSDHQRSLAGQQSDSILALLLPPLIVGKYKTAAKSSNVSSNAVAQTMVEESGCPHKSSQLSLAYNLPSYSALGQESTTLVS